LLCAEWGYPFGRFDLRLLVNGYLERRGKKVKKFKNGTMPGRDWADSFLTRHKNILAVRMCQNIKRSRAGVREVQSIHILITLQIHLMVYHHLTY